MSTVIEVYPGASAKALSPRPAELGPPEAEPSYKKSSATRRKVVMAMADRFKI